MNVRVVTVGAVALLGLLAPAARAAPAPAPVRCAELVQLRLPHLVVLEAVESRRIQFVSKPIPNG